MAADSGTNWTSVIIAFIVGGVVLGGLVYFTMSKPKPAPAPQPVTPPPTVTGPKVPCGNIKVEVSLSNGFVFPDPFTICQDQGANGHFKVTWEKAKGEPASLKTFKAEFPDGTPFADAHANDVSVYEWPAGRTSVSSDNTKNFNLKNGEYRYFNYKVTVCCDATRKPKTLDPGGIITP